VALWPSSPRDPVCTPDDMIQHTPQAELRHRFGWLAGLRWPGGILCGNEILLEPLPSVVAVGSRDSMVSLLVPVSSPPSGWELRNSTHCKGAVALVRTTPSEGFPWCGRAVTRRHMSTDWLHRGRSKPL